MKTLMPCLALLGVAAILTACAALPSKDDIAQAVTAPGVDAAAVHFETAVAVMATSIEATVADPRAGVDKVRLEKAVRKAADALDEARGAFDARSGDPVTLINLAFDSLYDAVPPTADIKIRLALQLGRGAATTYAMRLNLAGPPTPPSPSLRDARRQADRAIDALLERLKPPET